MSAIATLSLRIRKAVTAQTYPKCRTLKAKVNRLCVKFQFQIYCTS